MSGGRELYYSRHFVKNISRVKKNLKEWDFHKKERDEHDLNLVEKELLLAQDSKGGGFPTQEEKDQLGVVEARRRKLL